ncbi:MAG TPA: hypothetical protein VGD62_03390 [Acidobacteriaceae bacterium]
MRRTLLVLAASLALASSLAEAQFVRLAPPPPVAERRIPAPDARYVWVPGYQRWDGRAYHWEGGRWVLPPHPHAFWVAGHWAPRDGGYVWVPGHWRG